MLNSMRASPWAICTLRSLPLAFPRFVSEPFGVVALVGAVRASFAKLAVRMSASALTSALACPLVPSRPALRRPPLPSPAEGLFVAAPAGAFFVVRTCVRYPQLFGPGLPRHLGSPFHLWTYAGARELSDGACNY